MRRVSTTTDDQMNFIKWSNSGALGVPFWTFEIMAQLIPFAGFYYAYTRKIEHECVVMDGDHAPQA